MLIFAGSGAEHWRLLVGYATHRSSPTYGFVHFGMAGPHDRTSGEITHPMHHHTGELINPFTDKQPFYAPQKRGAARRLRFWPAANVFENHWSASYLQLVEYWPVSLVSRHRPYVYARPLEHLLHRSRWLFYLLMILLRRDVWPSGLARWLVDSERTVVGSNPSQGKKIMIVISCALGKGA